MYQALLVEDEVLVRRFLKNLIRWQDEGFNLAWEASHGEQALEILQKNPIDLLITDIRMPVMDGFSLIEEVHKGGFPCEVVVLSSYDDFQYLKRSIQLNVCDYIHKPTVNDTELRRVLHNISAILEAKKNEMSQAQAMEHFLHGSSVGEVFFTALLHQAPKGEEEVLIREMHLLPDIFRLLVVRFVQDKVEQPSTLQRARLSECFQKDSGQIFQDEMNWILLLSPNDDSDSMQFVDAYRQKYGDTLFLKISTPLTVSELYLVYPQLVRGLEEDVVHCLGLRASHDMIKQCVSIIQKDYHMSLTIERIAKELYVNPTHLGRIFHRDMGMGFVQYLKRYRLDKAKGLLRDTTMQVFEIAQKCGFKNDKYFIKVFHETEGLSPLKYRKREKSNYI